MTTAPWADLVTADDVLGLHIEGVKVFGGDATTRAVDRECVEGRLGSAWNAEAYRGDAENQKPGLIFAGYLLFYLAKAHCFVDGNKRVSWTTAMRVLASMGLTITASTDEAEQFIGAFIAPGGKMTGDDVVLWLAGRLIAAA